MARKKQTSNGNVEPEPSKVEKENTGPQLEGQETKKDEGVVARRVRQAGRVMGLELLNPNIPLRFRK
jgi:hypothetical protein